MEVRLVPRKTSTFHDWPYSGPRRKCFHAWIVNLTPPGPDHCIHDCVYCYARHAIYTRRPRGVMEVYSNLPELIGRDLDRLRLCPPFSVSNTTDPCQAVPEVRRETRRIVDLLVRRGPSFSITTKGDPSFLLDGEGFLDFRRRFVAVTVEGTPEVLRLASPGAPSYDERLRALRRMAGAGVPVIARLDPVLPHLWRALHGDRWERELAGVLGDLRDAGAFHVVCSTGRLSKAGPRPSMFDRIQEVVRGADRAEAEAMEREYEWDREGTPEGYLLRRPLRMRFHELARGLCTERGLTYATCQETPAEETDSPGLPHCEGACIPFTLKGADGTFRPVPGCTANCHVHCRGPRPPCGRGALVSTSPLKASKLR